MRDPATIAAEIDSARDSLRSPGRGEPVYRSTPGCTRGCDQCDVRCAILHGILHDLHMELEAAARAGIRAGSFYVAEGGSA